jgi:hypothetical protein
MAAGSPDSLHHPTLASNGGPCFSTAIPLLLHPEQVALFLKSGIGSLLYSGFG